MAKKTKSTGYPVSPSNKREFRIFRENMTIIARDVVAPEMYRSMLSNVSDERLCTMLGVCAERVSWQPWLVTLSTMNFLRKYSWRVSFLDMSLRMLGKRMRDKLLMMRVICFFAKVCRYESNLFAYIVADILTGKGEIPAWQERLDFEDDEDEEDEFDDDDFCEEDDGIDDAEPIDEVPEEIQAEEPGTSEDLPRQITFAEARAQDRIRNSPWKIGTPELELFMRDCNYDYVVVDKAMLEVAASMKRDMWDSFPNLIFIVPSSELERGVDALESQNRLHAETHLNIQVLRMPVYELPEFENGYYWNDVTKQEFYSAKYAVYALQNYNKCSYFFSNEAVNALVAKEFAMHAQAELRKDFTGK